MEKGYFSFRKAVKFIRRDQFLLGFIYSFRNGFKNKYMLGPYFHIPRKRMNLLLRKEGITQVICLTLFHFIKN